MKANNTMDKKYFVTAKWFIESHALEAETYKWQDGYYILAFAKGEFNWHYDQADGYDYIIPRRMKVREFVTLASLGKILTKEEVVALANETGCFRNMRYFVF